MLLIGVALAGACTKRRNPPTAVVPPPGVPSTALIRMIQTSFVPHDTTVSYGDTLLWVNASNPVHTTSSGPCMPCALDGLWDSGDMARGDSFRVVFGPGVDAPGIVHVDSTGFFPYFCIPHQFIPMDGTITVTN
jgi:plastocyanin